MIPSFPSPANNSEHKLYDLNSLLVQHPTATFFMKVDSNRYNNMGIYYGDLLTIDRAKKIKPNSLVVYEAEGQFLLGRVFNIHTEALITGVITHVIHTVKES